MPRSLPRTLIAALSLALVLVALTATSFAAWRCQRSGAVSAACCCAGAHGATADDGRAVRPAMTSPGCCDFERQQVQRAPSDVPRGQPTVAAPVGAVVLAVPAVTPGASVPAHAIARVASAGPPGGGRAVVLQKRAFLI